jgi:hypothetical protein
MPKVGLSPRLTIKLTEKQWEKAKRANSAGCLISDAIKRDYPHLTGVETDMATIRASDRAKGERYTWLTPQNAQDLLLAFDQGWDQPADQQIVLNGAVRITKIKAGSKAQVADQSARRVALEERVAAGEELLPPEKTALTKLQALAERPTSEGPVTDVVEDGDVTTVIGGKAPRKNPTKNPNLLAGRTRVYGARRAKPAQVFLDIVEAEVQRRVAELAAAGTSGETTTASQ